MVKVRNNYQNSHRDLYCPLCDEDLVTLENLLVCGKIHLSESCISYNTIFGNDCGDIRETFQVLKNSLHTHKGLLRAVEEETSVVTL